MSDAYLLDIMTDQICANFSASEGREWTPEGVRAWLIERDFAPTPDGWIAEEISLGYLAKTEYKLIKQIS